MNACISVGKLTEARCLVQDMKRLNIQLDIRVFNILLKGYSRAGDMSTVTSLLREVNYAGLKFSAVTYNTLIDMYARAGQLQEARQTCSDAQAAGQCNACHLLYASCPCNLLHVFCSSQINQMSIGHPCKLQHCAVSECCQ